MSECIVSEACSRPKHPWYAIRVKIRAEISAAAILREKGYEEYLPVCSTRHPWSDRVKVMKEPVFPGYFFCRFDAMERLLPIMTTPGVMGIVSAGKNPISVSDAEIEAVQAVLSSGLPLTAWPNLCAGSPVIIDWGPLAGMTGIVLDDNKRYRLIVSVPLLQRGVAVEIERDWVRPLPRAGGIEKSGEPALHENRRSLPRSRRTEPSDPAQCSQES